MTVTPRPAAPTTEPWRRNLGRMADERLAGERGDWWWTGTHPMGCAGFMSDGALTALPQLDLARAERATVQDYFDNGWALTETLFSALRAEEAFYRPPGHRLRHPMIFYYGHPACLYVNKLRLAGVLQGPVNAAFEALFETGVDEMSWDDMAKNDEAWPSIDEVLAYRRQVYALVTDVIQHHPGVAPGATFADGSPLWALAMGFEHERIHIETSSVLIRELPLALVQRPAFWPADHPTAGQAAEGIAPREGTDFPANALVAIPGDTVQLGKPTAFPSFAWDNAYGADMRTVPPFRAARQLVSNGEYHAFVVDGGYRDPRWWSEAGWGWRAFRNVKWPTFWVPDGPSGSHRFKLRAPFAELAMPWSWPVEVNHHEAKAYAAWRSARDGATYRLPTEAEHHLLRDEGDRQAAAVVELDPVMVEDGAGMAARGRNVNLAYGTPMPVDAGETSSAGVVGAMGNVWTWLEDDFHPLPGAKLDPLYDDFSAPCYDGEHHMILGGSFVSTGEEASVWARYHFRPHFHQFAGIRLIEAAGCDAVRVGRRGTALAALAAAERAVPAVAAGGAGENPYETRRLVDEYMLMHHGAPADVMPWPSGPADGLDFAGRCARLLVEACREAGAPMNRALDLGCAVGGASFELARTFGEVVGADWSQAFVDAAEGLRRDGEASYFLRHEGELGEDRRVVLDPAIARDRLRFERADAQEPPAHWGAFDAALLANLVDRLGDPAACLARLPGLIAPGGLVLVTTPYTWLAEYTPRERWLGGVMRDGVPVRGFDGLRAGLEGEFELVRQLDLPFVIREHVRKFQWSMAHASIWRRRG